MMGKLYYKLGSGALSGLMLDPRLLKITSGGVFIAPAGGSNHAGPYPNLFPNPAGRS